MPSCDEECYLWPREFAPLLWLNLAALLLAPAPAALDLLAMLRVVGAISKVGSVMKTFWEDKTGVFCCK